MRRTEIAIRKQQEVDRLLSDGRTHNRIAAERIQREATELLAPSDCVVSSGEVLPDSPEKFGIRDTLENPDSISQGASEDRLDLLCEVGSLEMGLDLSQAIEAKNSVEKMMSHHMAGMHTLAMKLLARASESSMPSVEAARLANSARGLMETFQNTILTIQRLRNGGGQRVVVQHVQMRDNSQAVIAGGGSS